MIRIQMNHILTELLACILYGIQTKKCKANMEDYEFLDRTLALKRSAQKLT